MNYQDIYYNQRHFDEPTIVSTIKRLVIYACIEKKGKDNKDIDYNEIIRNIKQGSNNDDINHKDVVGLPIGISEDESVDYKQYRESAGLGISETVLNSVKTIATIIMNGSDGAAYIMKTSKIINEIKRGKTTLICEALSNSRESGYRIKAKGVFDNYEFKIPLNFKERFNFMGIKLTRLK